MLLLPAFTVAAALGAGIVIAIQQRRINRLRANGRGGMPPIGQETATPAQLIEEHESRFRDLAKITSHWLWETDDQLRVTWVWGRAGYDFDGRGGSAIGKTAWQLLEGEDHPGEHWRPVLEAFKNREPFNNFEYSRVDPGGEFRIASLSAVPYFD